MYHLQEHINQDITRRKSKIKYSTVDKAEYLSKRNPTGKYVLKRVNPGKLKFKKSQSTNTFHYERKKKSNRCLFLKAKRKTNQIMKF